MSSKDFNQSLKVVKHSPQASHLVTMLEIRLASYRDTYEATAANEFNRGKIVAIKDLLNDITRGQTS